MGWPIFEAAYSDSLSLNSCLILRLFLLPVAISTPHKVSGSFDHDDASSEVHFFVSVAQFLPTNFNKTIAGFNSNIIAVMGSPSRSTIPDINDSINPNNNGNTAKSPRSISKKLHYLNIAGLIPCWALGLPLLIIDASIWSILAFIWSTLSSLTSLYRVCEKKKTQEYQIRLTDDGDEPKRKNYMGLWACVDFVLGGGVMSWAIITFTQQSGRRGTAFLLAYVSMVWFAQRYEWCPSLFLIS